MNLELHTAATELSRRRLLGAGLALSGLALAGCASAPSGPSIGRVVVVGGGFGGATAAKYLRRLNPALRITLVEPADRFVMCPMSNRVIYGGLGLADISRPYDRWASRHEIRIVRAAADDDDMRCRLRAGAQRGAGERGGAGGAEQGASSQCHARLPFTSRAARSDARCAAARRRCSRARADA